MLQDYSIITLLIDALPKLVLETQIMYSSVQSLCCCYFEFVHLEELYLNLKQKRIGEDRHSYLDTPQKLVTRAKMKQGAWLKAVLCTT